MTAAALLLLTFFLTAVLAGGLIILAVEEYLPMPVGLPLAVAVILIGSFLCVAQAGAMDRRACEADGGQYLGGNCFPIEVSR